MENIWDCQFDMKNNLNQKVLLRPPLIIAEYYLIESVALRRLDIRLAERLLQLAGEGQTEIRKTHQELAAELGTAREVISRYLKEFERKGWLQTQRGNLHLLDPDQMQQFLQQSA